MWRLVFTLFSENFFSQSFLDGTLYGKRRLTREGDLESTKIRVLLSFEVQILIYEEVDKNTGLGFLFHNTSVKYCFPKNNNYNLNEHVCEAIMSFKRFFTPLSD